MFFAWRNSNSLTCCVLGTRTWALWPLCFHVWILPHLLGEDISHCRSVCRRLIPALPLNARDCTQRSFSRSLSVMGVICESSVCIRDVTSDPTCGPWFPCLWSVVEFPGLKLRGQTSRSAASLLPVQEPGRYPDCLPDFHRSIVPQNS